MEEWKTVKDFENYEVSNLGNIRRKYKSHYFYLKPLYNKKGYRRALLYKDSKKYAFKLHRLIAQAFLNNYSSDLEVDHINTIRDDNRIENLRMVTHSENMNNPLTKINIKNGVNKHFEELKKLANAN